MVSCKNRKFGCLNCKHELEQIAWDDKDYKCPKCDYVLTELFKINEVSSFNIGKIASMSSQERQQVLKKRSKDHYKKSHTKKKLYGFN